MNDPIEWQFKEPASQVDIDLIHAHLANLNATWKANYILALEKNAPNVFNRYKDKYLGGTKGWGR